MKRILFLLFIVSAQSFGQYVNFGSTRLYNNGYIQAGKDTIYYPTLDHWMFSKTNSGDIGGANAYFSIFDTTYGSFGSLATEKKLNWISPNYFVLGQYVELNLSGSTGGTFGGGSGLQVSFYLNKNSGALSQYHAPGAGHDGYSCPSAINAVFDILSSNTDSLVLTSGITSLLSFEPSSLGHLKEHRMYNTGYNYWANGSTTIDTLIDYYAFPDPIKNGGGRVFTTRHYHFYGAVSRFYDEGIYSTQNPYFYEGGTMILGTLLDTVARVNIKGDKTKRWISEDISPSSSTMTFARDTVGGVLASHYCADTASFSGTATRTAVYIKGAKSTDCYTITWRLTTGDESTSPSETAYYYAKTDSLIVFRNSGTTSGLKFSYQRFMKQ